MILHLLTIQQTNEIENPETILGIGILTFFIIASILYFFPSIVALIRGKQNTVAIIALNFFLGWSVVGWVISLVWSLSSDNQTQKVVVNNTENNTNRKEDKFEQLEKLQKLLNNGTITQKEFNIQKKKLLRK